MNNEKREAIIAELENDIELKTQEIKAKEKELAELKIARNFEELGIDRLKPGDIITVKEAYGLCDDNLMKIEKTKQKLSNTPLYWDAIKDGDIIAICTNKRGLDTSHIGIAVWHIDGVHLLNASMIHKRTIEEPMTMQQYMQKHPSQTGIRVVRLK